MKTLWFFVKKSFNQPFWALAGLSLAFLVTLFSVSLMGLSGWFITAAAFAGLSSAAIVFNYFLPSAIIRFLALGRILSRYGERVIHHDYTFRLLISLRVWIYKALLPHAPAVLADRRSGDLLQLLMNDIHTLNQLYLRFLTPMLVSLFFTTTMIVFFYYYNPYFSATLFSFFVFMLFYTVYVFMVSQYLGKQDSRLQQSFRTELIDFFQGFLALKLFVNAQHRLQRLTPVISQWMHQEFQWMKLKSFSAFVLQLFSGLMMTSVIAMGIILVQANQLNGPQLAMIILCFMIAFEELMLLPLSFLTIGKTTRAAERLFQIAHQSIRIKQSNTLLFSDQPDIQFKNVVFQYPGQSEPIIHYLNLSVPFGSKLIITGPSGIGKTTLLKLLLRFYDVNDGGILVNNHSLSDYPLTELRENIAYVSQHTYIFNASVKDNLTLFNNAIDNEAINKALSVVGLTDKIDSLPNGIHTDMGENGKNFSGGEIQRIGIARALLTQSKIILLDEFTTGLNDALVQLICHHVALVQKTVIIVTHDERVLKCLSDYNVVEM